MVSLFGHSVYHVEVEYYKYKFQSSQCKYCTNDSLAVYYESFATIAI